MVPSDADINLIIGNGVTDLLKNPDASYETYLHISASALAGMLKNYNISGTVYATVKETGSEKLTNMYVYITGATPIPGPIAGSITNVTVDGTSVTAYDTVSDAKSHATDVAATTSVVVAATGTGTISLAVEKNETDNSFVMTGGENDGNFTSSADGQYDVIQITATGTTGTPVVKYVAVKANTYYTLSIDNKDTNCAVQITYGDNAPVVIGTTSGSVEIADNLKQGDQVTFTLIKETNKTTGAIAMSSGSTGASLVAFNDTYTVTIGTANAVVEIADA